VRHECPACQRAFDEKGFCPYDGTKLEAARETLQSVQLRAQSDADTMQAPEKSQIRAVSASGDTTGAKKMMRERTNEYDKLVGETLDGRYYVQSKLGEGGMGVVFAARHAVIERPLAIKVLKREATRDAATIKRFVQEAQAASRIGHPNIVDVTDFGTTSEGLTYSVMELISGTTLAKTIKAAAPFPAERAVRIAIQIARALGAAHDKGIVHRDLKPENVFLVDRDGRPDFVKIVDFGIAKVQPLQGKPDGPRLTKSGAVFGTPEYMAPEQAAGRSDTDHRVDIYALGTILYQMLVGRVPHKGGSMVRTIAMQMLDPITPPSQIDPNVPRSLEAIVMKALAKNRDERYQKMSELLTALDSIARELVSAASPTLALPQPPGADPEAATEPPGPPRRAKPPTKPLHEPEFVGRPLSLPQDVDDRPPVESRSKLPWVLAALALLSVIGATLVVVLSGRHGSEKSVAEVPRDAAAVAADAPQIVQQEIDAGMVAPPSDAAVVAHARDAGTHAADAAAVAAGAHPKMITVEVLTTPGEAELFVGHEHRGPGGTHMAEPYGTTLTVECRAPHYHGSKTIKFDGSITSAMCTATHLKVCVEGLKNPYEECEEPQGSSHGPIMKPDE
jgi:serine/threonine protein kinase